jgi:hypothetical protein
MFSEKMPKSGNSRRRKKCVCVWVEGVEVGRKRRVARLLDSKMGKGEWE